MLSVSRKEFRDIKNRAHRTAGARLKKSSKKVLTDVVFHLDSSNNYRLLHIKDARNVSGHLECIFCGGPMRPRFCSDRADHFQHVVPISEAPTCDARESHATTAGGKSHPRKALPKSINLSYCAKKHQRWISAPRGLEDTRQYLLKKNKSDYLELASTKSIHKLGLELMSQLRYIDDMKPATTNQRKALTLFSYPKTETDKITHKLATIVIFELAMLYNYACQHPTDYAKRLQKMIDARVK